MRGTRLARNVAKCFEALPSDLSPTDAIATVLRARDVSPGLDQGTRRRRGRNLTRFNLWQPSDADLDAPIAALEPVIDDTTRFARAFGGLDPSSARRLCRDAGDTARGSSSRQLRAGISALPGAPARIG